MKKFFMATALLAGLSTTAAADEMPIQGTCTAGSDSISFTGSNQPRINPSSGNFGVTVIFMNLQDYARLGLAPMDMVPDSEGYQPAIVGNTVIGAKHDNASNTASLRIDTDDMENVLQNLNITTNPSDKWVCSIQPNF